MDDRELQNDALSHIRRESLDLYNRIHSIAEDCEFVGMMRHAYPDLPILRELINWRLKT